MDAQMEELRRMMAQLLNANKAPAPPSLEVNASATQVEEGEASKESPSKIDGGKEEYHGVPFKYSVDPPIPHYHINNRVNHLDLIHLVFLIGNFL